MDADYRNFDPVCINKIYAFHDNVLNFETEYNGIRFDSVSFSDVSVKSFHVKISVNDTLIMNVFSELITTVIKLSSETIYKFPTYLLHHLLFLQSSAAKLDKVNIKVEIVCDPPQRRASNLYAITIYTEPTPEFFGITQYAKSCRLCTKTTGMTNTKLDMTSEYTTKGVFIMCQDNVEDITGITVYLKGRNFSLNVAEIAIYTQKINDDTIYLPLELGESFDSVRITGINTARIRIETKKQQDVTIYPLQNVVFYGYYDKNIVYGIQNAEGGFTQIKRKDKEG
jgi:hypothetical protein